MASGGRCDQVERDFRGECFVAVADYGGDSAESGQFCGRALCVAAGGHDARIRD